MFNFVIQVPKFGGPFAKKSGGQKNLQNLGCFGQLQVSTANISGKDRDIQNLRTRVSTAIHPVFGEKSPVNFSPLTTKLGVWVWTHPNQLLRKTIFRPPGGAASSNLHTH